jgi:DNA-binding transcriptional LysR family regulator
MQEVHLSALDLNLLKVLDALLEEAHVRKAGERVGLTQSATSHALSRLRHLFDDPLLVRAGREMVRTPRAEALRGPLSLILRDVQGLLSAAPFDARESRRSFRMMLPDPVCHLLAPTLLRSLRSTAPNVQIEFLTWRGPALLTSRALQEIDFLATSFDRVFPGFSKTPLFESTDVLAVRKGHPGRSSLGTIRGFEQYRHVAIRGAGEPADELDEWLDKVGLRRQVAVVAPNYLVALHIAAETDLVAFVPDRIATLRKRMLDLELIRPPKDPGRDTVYLFTTMRSQSDPATLWMKGQIENAMSAGTMPMSAAGATMPGPSTRDNR